MGRRTKQSRNQTGSPEPADRQATRQLIVRTAHQQFMEQGFRAVSTRRIAAACGLTQPAMYHYFADKEALYVEVLRTAVGRTQAALERIARKKGGIRQRLFEAVVYLILRMPEDMHQMFRDIERELSDDNRMSIRRCWREGYLLPLAQIFEETPCTVEPEQAALMLLGMVGPAAGRRSEPGEREAYRSWRRDAVNRAGTLVDVLLFGLLAESARQKADKEEAL